MLYISATFGPKIGGLFVLGGLKGEESLTQICVHKLSFKLHDLLYYIYAYFMHVWVGILYIQYVCLYVPRRHVLN